MITQHLHLLCTNILELAIATAGRLEKLRNSNEETYPLPVRTFFFSYLTALHTSPRQCQEQTKNGLICTHLLSIMNNVPICPKYMQT